GRCANHGHRFGVSTSKMRARIFEVETHSIPFRPKYTHLKVGVNERTRSSTSTRTNYFCVMTMNQAVWSLSSPARTKYSPLLRDLTVLLTGLPSPMSLTSTFGPGSSVISTVHCLLSTIGLVERLGIKT